MRCVPLFLNAARFFMVAEDPMEMRRCLDVVRFLSCEMAPRSNSIFWSTAHRAEMFQRAPHALPTTASDGDL